MDTKRLPRKLKKRLKPALIRKKTFASAIVAASAYIQTAKISSLIVLTPSTKAIKVAEIVFDTHNAISNIQSETIFDFKRSIQKI